MSRTKKGKKAPGYDFWSRRPSKIRGGFGKFAKKMTHRAERIQGKKEAESRGKE